MAGGRGLGKCLKAEVLISKQGNRVWVIEVRYRSGMDARGRWFALDSHVMYSTVSQEQFRQRVDSWVTWRGKGEWGESHIMIYIYYWQCCCYCTIPVAYFIYTNLQHKLILCACSHLQFQSCKVWLETCSEWPAINLSHSCRVVPVIWKDTFTEHVNIR